MPFLAALGDLLKKQAKVPEFKPVSPADEELKAVRGNTVAIADLKKLAAEADKLTTEQFQARLGELFPNLGDVLQGTSRNIASMTRGEIPEDVASAVERRGAARAYAGGYGGSQRASFLTSRDLGLTSLGLTQKALDNASRWIGTLNAAAPAFDVTSMFITPETQLKNTWMNEQARMNNEWMRNLQEAERAPGTIFGNALNQADAFAQQAAVSFVGGMGVGRGLGKTLPAYGGSYAPPATSWPPGYP